jgi:hypothetical protein
MLGLCESISVTGPSCLVEVGIPPIFRLQSKDDQNLENFFYPKMGLTIPPRIYLYDHLLYNHVSFVFFGGGFRRIDIPQYFHNWIPCVTFW